MKALEGATFSGFDFNKNQATLLFGDQVDFLSGSAMSRGCFSIIALPSTAQSGKVSRIAKGDVHRMALDYELAELAPSGALDYCYPPDVNRFFAVWTNPVR